MSSYTLDVLSFHKMNLFFYSSLVILKIVLNSFFYIQRSPATIKYCFTQFRELPINYLYVMCKYYQTGKDGGVLGCLI